jgi:hypothetical protein
MQARLLSRLGFYRPPRILPQVKLCFPSVILAVTEEHEPDVFQIMFCDLRSVTQHQAAYNSKILNIPFQFN